MLRSASVAPSAACGNSWARNAKLAEMVVAMIVPLEFTPEGSGLERGEEGVEFGEVGSESPFLPLDCFECSRETLLDLDRWDRNADIRERRLADHAFIEFVDAF